MQKSIAYLSSITRWNICILLTVQAFVKPSPFRINRPTGSKAKQAGYSSFGYILGYSQSRFTPPQLTSDWVLQTENVMFFGVSLGSQLTRLRKDSYL